MSKQHEYVNVTSELAPSAPPPPPPSYDEAVGGTQYGGHSVNQSHMNIPQVNIQHPSSFTPNPQMQATLSYHNQQPVAPKRLPPAISHQLIVGMRPLVTVCPSCHTNITTRIVNHHKYSPHVCCFLMCASVVCACCSCLPYLFCPKMRVEHFCPSCNARLGVYIPS